MKIKKTGLIIPFSIVSLVAVSIVAVIYVFKSDQPQLSYEHITQEKNITTASEHNDNQSALTIKSDPAKAIADESLPFDTKVGYQQRLASILQLESSDEFKPLAFELFTEWGASDIEAALEWLKLNGHVDDVHDYYRAAFLAAMDRSSQDVSQLIIDLPSDLLSKPDIVYDYAKLVGYQDIPQALIWTSGLPELDLRDYAHHTLFNEWSSRNPQEVLNNLASYPDISDMMREQVIEVAVSYQLRDKDLVGQEFISQYPQDIRRELTSSAVEHMMLYAPNPDMDRAMQWVKELPADGLKDAALETYIRTASTARPLSEAFELAQSVSNKNLREQLIVDSFENWYSYSHTAATETLMASDFFSEEKKRAILEKAQTEYPLAEQQSIDGIVNQLKESG